MSRPALIVIAKAPRAGHSKTRLCPPCSPVEAAGLAEAALGDTLEAVGGACAGRRILALEGTPGTWLPAGMELTAQRGHGFDERLAAAFEDAAGPAFLVAMDTPQLTPALLNHALDRLTAPGVDAVLGPTCDGGYWGIGLRRPDPAVFEGVPMSTATTCSAQLARLAELGLATEALPTLTDVDTIDDARAVARAAPATRFARALAASGHAADEREPVAYAGA